MTAKEFLHIDLDEIPRDQLLIAEMMLCDMVPCGLCGRPTPRRHEWHHYEIDGCETCSARDEKIEWNRQQRWRH